MELLTDPAAITTRSREIIAGRLGSLAGTAAEKEIIYQAVHASGDLGLAGMLLIDPRAVTLGIEALQRGAAVITDVEMVRAGISKKLAGSLGVKTYCAIGEPETASLAAAAGITRAMAAIRRQADRLPGAVVAIGNAPTALLEVLRLAEGGQVPSMIVGVPVGFVGAAEIKEMLAASPWPYITVAGPRGGSTVAVSVINALLRLATGDAGGESEGSRDG
ncbi:MAG: precorrin isomerase [Clostridia bacterium]|nr:MAG: precorrin isomerase [Clostridia bacterium]